MNALFKKVTSDKIIRYSSIVSVLLLIFDTVYIAILYRHFPPYLPIFNQMPWGEMRLGDRPIIFLPVILSFGITLLNFFFATQLHEQMPLLSRMIIISSLLINIITCIFVIRITQLVI